MAIDKRGLNKRVSKAMRCGRSGMFFLVGAGSFCSTGQYCAADILQSHLPLPPALRLKHKGVWSILISTQRSLLKAQEEVEVLTLPSQ